MFAGHDCSVSLAKMKLDLEWLDKYGQVEISANEQKTLDEWHNKFVQKYK